MNVKTYQSKCFHLRTYLFQFQVFELFLIFFIKSLSSKFIIMVRVGEDQAILTLERIHALGVSPETKAASLRSRAIVSQERIRVYSCACFG